MASKKTGLRARLVKAAAAASSGGGKGKEPAAGGTVGLTTRIPTELHERLREYAFKNRVSINSLILEGLETRLKR